jgi:endonuclease/exonuclease/phosphatase family metal-dependent hydrolase
MDLERIASVLNRIGADVIGLQEVGWHRPEHPQVDQFAYLRAHTGYDVIEGLVRDPLRSHFGNAVLTRLPVLRQQWIDLKVRGHAPRAAIAADLGDRDGRPDVRIVVTHLGLTPQERRIQVGRLMEALMDAGTGDGTAQGGEASAPIVPPSGVLPTIVLGDFNLVRRQTRASRLLEEHFPTFVSEPTYPSWSPQLALDRIYLSGHWRVETSHVLHTGLAKIASDHLPLIAQVRLDSRAVSADAAESAAGS